MVPVTDLSRRTQRYLDGFTAVANDVLRSGQLLLGPRLQRFEEQFAAFAGGSDAIAVASGATAIQLSLSALGIGPGDEVIVPAFTAVPTASAVCAVGATPVPADVDPCTAVIDRHAIEAVITDKTRAVIVVHLYGYPADITTLATDLAARDIAVVEDAAQAHGALLGVVGATACYSFYPTKNLGGIGDGGAIVLGPDAAERSALLRRLRVHGMTQQYVHTEISQNFRISEIEAAWLSLCLPDLGVDNQRRRAVAAHYREAAPQLHWAASHERHAMHLCVTRVSDRERFRNELSASNVASAVHYPLAVTEQPAYRRFTRAACPNAEAWAASCVSVPCFPELTDGEVEQVADALAGARP
ncbi:MAG: DegT/DnrJ/EryC1/StrS family aminotransferase [Acidimicrobiia bacterium]